MARVDLVAEWPHYRDHLQGIWDRLPDHVRGIDWADGPAAPRSEDLLLVAGYSDVKRHPHRRVVYAEHGAGQSYVGLAPVVAPFYSGGGQHRNVILHLCPNQETADRWFTRYPKQRAVVVGYPRLDPWHAGGRGEHEPRTVAITFHWDMPFTGVPETTSAFGHYLAVLPEVVRIWRDAGWQVLGHNHPRYSAVADFWKQPDLTSLGVTYVNDPARILDRAHVLVADNTSLQAEFLSLGRPVVYLNHPAYRRDVEHGGRFWQWPSWSPTQHSIDTPEDLARLNFDTLSLPNRHPFAYADGNAGQRAADAICSLLL